MLMMVIRMTDIISKMFMVSLNSPRHFEIFPVGVNINSYGSRYIKIFDIDDIDGDCRGGGYPGARNSLETDLGLSIIIVFI